MTKIYIPEINFSEPRIETLLDINDKMNGHPYAIMGSTALPIQRVDIEPNDIDVLTDYKGAYHLSATYHDNIIKPVSYSVTDKFRSHFGQILYNEQMIEVMGDLEIKVGNHWESCKDLIYTPLMIQISDTKIPFLRKKDLLNIYRGLGREKDIKKIVKIWESLRKPELISTVTKN